MMKITVFRRLTLFGHRWYWRCQNTGNNRVMATGAEGYINRADILKAVYAVRAGLGLAEIEVQS